MSRLMLGLGGRAGMRRRALRVAVLPAAHVQPAIGGSRWARPKPSASSWTSSALPGGCWRRMGWVAETIRIDNAQVTQGDYPQSLRHVRLTCDTTRYILERSGYSVERSTS